MQAKDEPAAPPPVRYSHKMKKLFTVVRKQSSVPQRTEPSRLFKSSSSAQAFRMKTQQTLSSFISKIYGPNNVDALLSNDFSQLHR